MKIKVFTCFLLSLFISSSVFAAPLGEYNGKSIVRVTSDGKQLTAFETPAYIDEGGNAMVPLYMLRQAGFQVTWNPDYTVDVKKPEPLTEAQIAKLSESVGLVYGYDKDGIAITQGSGFIIEGGIFITNHHVAGKAAKLEIRLNGKTYTTNGQHLFSNEKTDVYGVKIDAPSTLTYSDKALLGTNVYAIGYPDAKYRVSKGWVGAVSEYNGVGYLGHDADTDPGSSGGALLNEKGEVIGITSAGQENTTIEGAVPFTYVIQELNKLK